MKRLLVAFAYLCFFHAFGQQLDLSGKYRTQFVYGNFATDIEFDIVLKNDLYKVSFNSLAQNAFGVPASEVQVSADTLEFALQSDSFRYYFRMHPIGQQQLKSRLNVDGKDYDFYLERTGDQNDAAIASRDIRFKSQGFYLYGTIYYPENPNGKAIYLLTSSGDQDRSASRAEAIFFARAGYVTLHIDKRGTGLSDGNWQLADIPELCEDDLQALEFLHQSEHIDYNDIGIKGSSQGAAKVPYLLHKKPELGAGIMISCPASSLLESDLNYWKNRNIQYIGKENIDNAFELQKSVFQYISGDIDKVLLEYKIGLAKTKPWFQFIWIPDLDSVTLDKKLNYSPLPYFQGIETPLLVIEGTEDQVIPDGSMIKIKTIIGNKGNPANQFLELQGADHSMMFTGVSDFPYWFALHPDYLPAMLNWLSKQ